MSGDVVESNMNGKNILLKIFIALGIIISIFLISINDYLHIIERKKDIGLLRCIGINKRAATSYLYTHSFVISLLAFGIASIQLFVISILGNLGLSKMMNLPFVFSFSLIPYLAMFVVGILSATIPAYLISYKLNKYNPLDALKN